MEEIIEYLKKENNVSNLDEIKSLIIDEEIDPYEDYSFLNKLTNLEELTLKKCYITISIIDNINKLEHLKTLSLYNSELSTEFKLNIPITKLIINNLENFTYSFLDNQNIQELYLDNMEEIDLKKLVNLEKYKTLSFENTKLINQDYLFYLTNIIKLDLFNTKTEDISILLSLEHLKFLIVDKDIAINNKEFILDLMKKNIIVVDNLNRNVAMYYE